jgi:hypothetical protein
LGCEAQYYSVSITNESLKAVSYIFDGHSDTLNPSESKAYEVLAYTQPPENIVDQNGVASIKLNRNGMTGDFSFINFIPFNLNVINIGSSGNVVENA